MFTKRGRERQETPRNMRKLIEEGTRLRIREHSKVRRVERKRNR